MTESGATQMTGDLPVNCSGGVLSTNPIGASGMIRFGEAAMQVRGTAGDHQVDGARVALGHAYGGAAQFYRHVGGGGGQALSRTHRAMSACAKSGCGCGWWGRTSPEVAPTGPVTRSGTGPVAGSVTR